MRTDTHRPGIRWRDVGLGVVATVAVLGIALAALVLSLSPPGDRSEPAQLPAGVPPAPTRPADLGADETWFASVDLTTDLVATADGPLHDVDAEGTGVRVGPDGIGAESLEVRATLPFATAAEQIGEGVSLTDAGGNRVRVSRTVSLAGRDVTLSGTGSVRVEDGRLVVQPRTVDVGPGWLSSVASGAVEDLVTVRHTVQGLPEGTRLRSISVTEEGFAVHLSGREVQLSG